MQEIVVSSPFVITPARNDRADIEAIASIERDCFAQPTFDVAEELERPWARIWVARSSAVSAPAAFMLAWQVADELHILSIATAVGERRRGLAKALMSGALAHASQNRCRLLLLEVRRSNLSAIALYRHFGFSAIGVRTAYYADNDEDAIEMILALDPATGEVIAGRDAVRIQEA